MVSIGNDSAMAYELIMIPILPYSKLFNKKQHAFQLKQLILMSILSYLHVLDNHKVFNIML